MWTVLCHLPQSEFQDSQGYAERPCIEKDKNSNKKEFL